MNKAEIISRHAQALKGQVGTSLAIDECEDIMASMMNEAINFIRCSTQLKDKYSEDFAYFVEKKVKEQKVGSIYWYKGTGYTDLDKLFKEYQKLTKPLIV